MSLQQANNNCRKVVTNIFDVFSSILNCFWKGVIVRFSVNIMWISGPPVTYIHEEKKRERRLTLSEIQALI